MGASLVNIIHAHSEPREINATDRSSAMSAERLDKLFQNTEI